ncbi:MAG: metal ABC transporter permease [Epsilonproteobacteria bacterium]|nr:metal ABC transporter permease [Campylobacterota bacterium]
MFDLLQNAFIASLFISVAVGVIGSYVVINRFNYLAASIAHGSYAGVGFAVYFGISILLGTTVFALLLALLLSFISFNNRSRSDTLIGVIWAVGMSIGIIFTDLTPGYNADLMSYLFGNILMVPKSDLIFMAVVDLIILISGVVFYNHILAISYDIDFAKLRGIRVGFLYTYFLILIALTVVMSVRSIGLILVIALFTIPPYISEKFTKDFKAMMFLSGVLAFVFCIAGLYISYSYDISATPAIILTASVFFFLSLFKRR